MTTSEPTTGEIVRALRCVAEAIECKDCRYKYTVGNVILCDHEQMNGNAADRLESQERELSEKTEQLEKLKEFHEKCCGEMARAHVEEVTALTARAEQAELARDILCGTIRDMEEPKTVGSSTFTIERRGLPQEGDKDE